MLYYCKKCGRIIFLFDSWKRICDCCKSDVYPVPEQYLSSEFSLNEDLKENFLNEYIKSSSEFDQHLYEEREKNVIQHAEDFEKYNSALNHGKAILEEKSRVPKCPTCGSANLKRISTTSKVMSVALFGLLSTKRSRTFHCNNCGYEW